MPTFVVLVLVHLLGSLALAQSTCVPTETTDPRIVLSWPAVATVPDGHTLAAYRLQRVGDAPAMLPPLAPDALTLTDTVPPGDHAWSLLAQFTRTSDGATFLSDLAAPHGEPPPCVIVLASVPTAPTLLGVSPASTLTGVTGMHVRWALEGLNRPVRIERQTPGQPWAHVGSAPGGFFFDLFALEPGQTYCYRACLLHTETPACSTERCGVAAAGP